MQSIKRGNEALGIANIAVEISPNTFEPRFHRGMVFQEFRQFTSSAVDFRVAFALRPSDEQIVFDVVNADAMRAYWKNYRADKYRLRDHLESGVLERTGSGFPTTVMFMSQVFFQGPSMMQRIAMRLAAEFESIAKRSEVRYKGHKMKPGAINGKMRLGYTAADFHDHPLSYAIHGIVERHDRSRFDVVGNSPSNNSSQS